MRIDVYLTPEQIRALDNRAPSNAQAVLFRLHRDGNWVSADRSLTVKRPLVVGTLGGRHDEMYADLYLAGKVRPGQSAFDYVYERMVRVCRFAPQVEVHLMYTGLTETTLAAYSALLAHQMRFTVLRYDNRAKGYIPLDISRFLYDLALTRRR